jgi:hypothetical protein
MANVKCKNYVLFHVCHFTFRNTSPVFKKFVLLGFVFFNALLLSSQSNPRPPLKSDKDQNYSGQLTITDANGMPIKPEYANVEGSPYFISDFRPAIVKMRSGLVFEKVKAKIDLCKQEVNFITDNNVEIVTSGESVKEIILTDSLLNTDLPENRVYTFRTGFPSIDNQNGLNFYQVLTEGNITLLKSARKIITEKKNDISGEIVKGFEIYIDYYVFTDNKMIKLKKEKEWILSFLQSKKDKVDTFLTEKRISFKKIDDIITLFKYYNSL